MGRDSHLTHKINYSLRTVTSALIGISTRVMYPKDVGIAFKLEFISNKDSEHISVTSKYINNVLGFIDAGLDSDVNMRMILLTHIKSFSS